MRILIFGLMAVIVGCVEPIDRPENITPTSQPIASFTQVPAPVVVTFTPRPQPNPTTEPTATATSTATASPTPEPSPTPEQAPTAVPTDTPEPAPTDTPVPTSTPTPTATATSTATPTHTPEPGPELFVDVLGPADGATVQSDAIVVYGFTNPVATLSINGKPASVGQNGRFQEEVTLEPGENRIDIIATDNRGSEAVESITVTLLQPQPFVLVITEPEDQSIVFTDNVRLSGFTSPDAVVSVNGISISVETFGGIGLFETAMMLDPGPNIIDIVATNSGGKVLSTVIAIIYRPN